jgi:chromosomal replication initiation ATPase DnaA
VSSQLVLPLLSTPSVARNDFVVGPGNEQAVALIDSWPNWPVGVVVIHGPSGSGKTHLVASWQALSGAHVCSGDALEFEHVEGASAVEDVDASPATEARDRQLFRLIESASPATPLLLTGREAPSAWATVLPDLASRFSAALSLPLWKPDDELLAVLARKLFADRQVAVPDAVVWRILQSLERSPQALRDFIARADAKAFSEARPITLALVRELIAEGDEGLS